MIDLNRRLFLAGAAGTAIAARASASGLAPAADPSAVPVNPLVRQRADAQIFRHSDGFYYLTGSVPEYDRLVLRRSRTIAGLATAEERVLWRHQTSGPMSGYLWAPELHLIDGKWIMYFAAGPSGGGEDVFRIRTYAVVCDGPDPMAGSWTVLGKLETPWDGFNLDSTVFDHRGVRYLCWAEREPGIATNSNLYLAPLATPLTLGAKPARLTVPTLDWEIRGYKVAEAPALLARNGRLFLTYSASATDARYCLGMLTAADDADIMNPASWTKSPEPVFTTSRLTNVYGPGHNSFTVDEQGRDLLVYHGRDYEKIEGDPLLDPNRHTRVQRIYYRDDGTPDFGIPVGNGPVPDRFSPLGASGSFIRHEGAAMLVGKGSIASSQFRQIPSPLGGGAVSLEPIDAPGQLVAAFADGRVALIAGDASPATARATAFLRTQVGEKGVRFALAARPKVFLRHAGGALRGGSGAGSESVFTIS
ncbi:glycoside hydrolase family 43 protein [Sphingomonas sp. M1-B02]|uniref:glycoside hydrolase family 43 protein n=1 Tax=Sphingomonas sp. M1-B02 TaxID=3114300 RepID=UPI00224057A8|nr:glycoside hydrolase family 43 protein [Sphingomonas sp. S6-11]UZK67661.1 glycoside hydrolase family 43 protein [Sphingomonas sp. S6-11]